MNAVRQKRGSQVILLLVYGATLPHDQEYIQALRNILLEQRRDNELIVEVILGNIDRVNQLLDQDGIPDQTGKTALHWAAAQGNDQLVRLLLDHGFAIDAQDLHGHTPLHLAARNGNLSTVNFLVARGAQRALVNRQGQSSLTLARRYNRPDVIAFFEEQERQERIAVFGRLSRAGRRGEFEWGFPAGAMTPTRIAQLIAQFYMAGRHIPHAGSLS
jgi:hypothetical protein